MAIPTRPNKSKILIFDIETIPQDEKKLLATAPDFLPNSQLKDPFKIEKSIAEQKRKYVEQAALDWKSAHIVLVGFGCAGKIQQIQAATEKAVIEGAFQAILTFLDSEIGYICGHFIKSFDLPMLINRARVLGVRIPLFIYNPKHFRTFDERFVDTAELITFGNKQSTTGNGVDSIARALGFPEKLGTGKDFPQLWKKNRPAALKYNARDIEIETRIAALCGFK